MKFTLPWLKEHLDTDAPLGEIVDKLTMIGLEVENVEDKAKQLEPFKIASVISAEKHPNADRLRVCMVDTGDGKPIQVVCGAPNARAGMKARVSAARHLHSRQEDHARGRQNPRRRKPRHADLGGRDRMISDDHDGIIDMPADAPVGKPLRRRAGLNDPVIEINLTPNRPDCTGVNGIARDLGATAIGDFKDNARRSR